MLSHHVQSLRSSWRENRLRSVCDPQRRPICLLSAVPLLSTPCGAAMLVLVSCCFLSARTPHTEPSACQHRGRDKDKAISRLPRVTPVDGTVDLQEEEMEQSVFGLCFALDPSTVHPSLHLSNASLTVTYQGPATKPPHSEVRRSKAASDPGIPCALPQACANVIVTRGQYYWEVDVCNSSMYRIVYDGSWEPICTVPPQIKSLGVFLNIGGGTLSFHNPLTQEHLATLPTRFGPAGVLPALGLGQGRLRLRCRLPPPPHVFLCKDSAYRGPSGAGGARWRREIPFQSVRKVIQKFEELAVSDSDSGLVSSFGSSCSTLASLPDLGIPG
ncbi:hypothetical protein INR49_032708, partial [Caranx melampygus]